MQDEHQDLMSQTDDQLMVSVRDAGCAASFEVLANRWREPIVRLCYRMVFCWADAEDLTQDVFSRLYRSRHRYQTTAKFSTYLWKIAINRCRDFLRSVDRQTRKHKELIESPPHEFTNVTRETDTTDRVRTALARLAPMYREVLVLRHYENLKFNQIANVLEIPFGTVASRMSKALKLLGDQLTSDATTQ